MEAQGLFVNICSYYWMKGCNMSLTSVQHRFNGCSSMLDELINNEILTVNDDEISVNFLNEQFEQFAELVKKKSHAGRASAKARKGNKRSTGVQQVVHKEEKIRKDKKKEDNKEIPTLEEFLTYAKEKKQDVNVEAVKLKYSAWVENGWKDGNDNSIKNWKSKLLHTMPHLPDFKKNEQAHDRTKTEGAPEDFGIPSPTSITHEQYLATKK